ncbi:MAG: glycosyl hydrolase family 43, partial [Pirellulaceae bacterium]|nr:glycosyl hydrolase family 43 [Pirellulaceae bacterium]
VSTGILPGKVDFMTPEWRELFAFAVAEADRLGLEIIMNNDDGWTGSGGPWNTVENSMQVLTSSEVRVKGPSRFEAVLPSPPAKLDYYRDIAILALPDSHDNPDAEKAPGIENWQAKAGYGRGFRIEPETGDAKPGGIPSANIIDLTSRVDADGRLQWDVPEGNWTVLRLGHTTTGRQNHPCTPHGVGLECDKLSKEAMEKHFDGFLAKLIADVGPLAGKSLIGTHIDSWEVGSQNWTPKLREEFKSRRGYDPTPYYPTLAGHVVENLEVSERFLWDYRKTLADMMADNYFGHLGELAKKHGMIISAEAYGGDFDHLQAASRMDIPMSEFWVRSPEPNSPSNSVTMMDPTSEWASSAAHVAGRKIVAAEAFTATDHDGKWHNYPYKIKALGDRMFAEGVNRFVFHRYAMQPWMDRLPGMTFGPWGTCIERTLTWFEPGQAWFRYLARCQHLLQEGDFVADICFFHGESAPNHAYDRAELESRLPTGYDYDGCNDEAIMNMTVEDGVLALPSRMHYRVLVLPESRFMTPELVAKIRELVRDGAHVVGPRPDKSPSLANYPACDDEVRRLADELWGDVSTPGERAVG